VAGRDEAGARHGRVTAFRKELDEAPADLGGGQRLDPWIALGDGGRHGRNGTERAPRSDRPEGAASARGVATRRRGSRGLWLVAPGRRRGGAGVTALP